MATKRKRDAKGRFVRRAAPRRNPQRRAPARRAPAKRAPAKRAPARRAAPRRNPPLNLRRMGDAIIEGGMNASLIVAGKAASYSLPDLVGLPRAGATGLGVRLLTGVVMGLGGDMVGYPALGARLMEGAFVGAIEDAAVGYEIPWLGTALSRAPGLASYPRSPYGGTMAAYPRRAALPAPRAAVRTLGSYPRRGAGASVHVGAGTVT
jgi:hypothetical protein